MKKAVILILIAMIMTACGNKVHENIDEEMVKDTGQILDIMDGVVEEGELSENEEETFHQYYIKYSAKEENPDLEVGGLTEEENRLFILAKKIVENPEFYFRLESDKEAYEDAKRRIQNVIETGQIYDD